MNKLLKQIELVGGPQCGDIVGILSHDVFESSERVPIMYDRLTDDGVKQFIAIYEDRNDGYARYIEG